MVTFFATILIIYLLWLLIKPLVLNYARRKYAQKVNDMFNQAFGANGPAFGGDRRERAGQQYGGYRQPPRSPRRKKKIFSRDEGEYVEFEEIEVKAEYKSASSSDPSYTPREPQVSDADWEDIR